MVRFFMYQVCIYLSCLHSFYMNFNYAGFFKCNYISASLQICKFDVQCIWYIHYIHFPFMFLGISILFCLIRIQHRMNIWIHWDSIFFWWIFVRNSLHSFLLPFHVTNAEAIQLPLNFRYIFGNIHCIHYIHIWNSRVLHKLWLYKLWLERNQTI